MKNFLIVIISLFCLIYFFEGDHANFSERVYVTSQMIILFSTIMIFSEVERVYSLKKMFYLFSFFFFGIAPLVQFQNQITLFNARQLLETEYFYLNILILLIFLFYEVFYRLFSLKAAKINIKQIDKFEISTCTFKQTLLLLFISFVSLVSVLYINNFDINRLIFRGGEVPAEVDTMMSSSFNLIFTQTLRPLAIICFLYYILSPQKNTFIASILFLSALLAVFPTAVARFYAAAVYIPISIILFKFLERKYIFSVIFIFGLLIVFPFLNNFRHFSEGVDLELKLDFDMFNEGHFDSYQNFGLIHFENIITWGKQLLGVIFFWVPRTIWPTKPIGSGFVLAEQMNFSWNNVSANFFAEGYINFGYLGIFIFIILLAFATSKLDTIYWKEIVHRKNNFFKVIYLILLGMLFFMMRGDLLSSTAFTIGFLMSILIVFKFVHKKSHAINN